MFGGVLALAVTVLLPQGVAAAGRIDMAQVEQCWVALNRLVELDDHPGGGGVVYELAARMAQRMRDASVRGALYPGQLTTCRRSSTNLNGKIARTDEAHADDTRNSALFQLGSPQPNLPEV